MRSRKWLNDEIINAYISLVNQRKGQRAYVMNTFFYTLLEDMHRRSDYSFAKCERVIKRKKVDLKSYAFVLFPINVTSSHWFLAAYEISTGILHIIDSLLTHSYLSL